VAAAVAEGRPWEKVAAVLEAALGMRGATAGGAWGSCAATCGRTGLALWATRRPAMERQSTTWWRGR
jgi:hypothetical protein